MTSQEFLTKEERIAILHLAAKTWDGENKFNKHLGELVQFVQDGIYHQVFTVLKETKNDTDRTEINEGETQNVLS